MIGIMKVFLSNKIKLIIIFLHKDVEFLLKNELIVVKQFNNLTKKTLFTIQN